MTIDVSTTDSLQARFDILEEEQQARKRFIDLTPADERALRDIQPLVVANADAIVDGFYRNIERHAELQAIIEGAGSSVDRLRSAQKQYLLELFSGDYGSAYVERRLKIGVIHNRIGLTPKWYLGSYSVYMQLITRLLRRRYFFRPGKVMRYVCALDKILSFDAQLAIDTYIGALVDDLKAVSLDKGGIERTVSRYADFVGRVAEGDLSQRLEVTGEGDLGLLGEQLNRMTESLATMASQTRDVSNVLNRTLDDLLGNVQSHASAAAQQAAAVSEATATLEQIRTIAQRNQEHVTQMGDMAERTRTEGERGQQLVDDSVRSMADIRRQVHGIAENILALSERTQQIGAITGTVNDLAHQLKMLALNASIEAAQAGDAGKGFAVVAAEVKNLAEQSQRATEQVDGILSEIRNATDRAVMATEDGGKGVEKGSEQVQQAGVAVRALADAILQSANASEAMADAVRQEGQGIEQVTTAMMEIDGATRQFLDAAEQTRNATEQLSGLARRMADSVQAYRLR